MRKAGTFAAGGVRVALAAAAVAATLVGVQHPALAQSNQQLVNRLLQQQSEAGLRSAARQTERSLETYGSRVQDRTIRQSQRLRLYGDLEQLRLQDQSLIGR